MAADNRVCRRFAAIVIGSFEACFKESPTKQQIFGVCTVGKVSEATEILPNLSENERASFRLYAVGRGTQNTDCLSAISIINSDLSRKISPVSRNPYHRYAFS